eukprot:m.97181 g.97181  ORF g.97181 m.97181 type:complete len:61 (-) comp13095_c0_seq2:2642-2824(-)
MFVHKRMQTQPQPDTHTAALKGSPSNLVHQGSQEETAIVSSFNFKPSAATHHIYGDQTHG